MGISDALSNNLEIKKKGQLLLVYKFYTPISQVFLDLNTLKQVTNITISINLPYAKVLNTKLNNFEKPYFSSKYMKNAITLKQIDIAKRSIFIENLTIVLKSLHSYTYNKLVLKKFRLKDELKKFWLLLNTKDQNLSKLYKHGIYLAMIMDEGKLQKNLCHNDLVNGNILWIKNKIKLIDFDFASINYRLFDICSFLSENKLTNEEKELFLQLMSLSTNEKKYIDKMISYQNILWSFWALYYFKYKKKNVYLEIAMTKLPNLISTINV